MHTIFYVLVCLLFVYEVWALVRAGKGKKGDTISEIIWEVTSKRPVVPFLFGMLMGHLFWRW